MQAIREFRDGIKYVTKYMTKMQQESKTQTLTLALWLFKKRTFAVSGDFLESLKTTIKTLKGNRLVQIDLQGAKLSLNVEYIFIGIFHAKKLGIDGNDWWKIIADRAVLNEILT